MLRTLEALVERHPAACVGGSLLAQSRILGGIAFKCTSTFTDDAEIARRETTALRGAVDVVTTSGSGTGSPPSVDKIRSMKTAALKPLAVASGLSPVNVVEYEGLIEEVLVASSIETSPYSGVFDRTLLSRMITECHRR